MALIYVIWRAYQAEGETYVPQTIEHVCESLIVEFHRHAEKTGKFDRHLARRLLNYLQANYTSNTDELGSAILRRDIANGANVEALKKLG